MPRIALAYVVAALALAAACSTEAPSPVEPPLSGLSPAGGSPADESFAPGRLVVRFRPGAPVAQLVASENAAVHREIGLGIALLSVPEGRELQVAAALARNPHVEFAEPDWLRAVEVPCATGDCFLPNDADFPGKWDLHNDGSVNAASGALLASTGSPDSDIDWLEAFNALGGKLAGSVRVGILDTGVRASHQDLSGKVVAQRDFYYDDANAADDHGHGTHIAGIAAGSGSNNLGVTGVAWGANVTLAVAKVCGLSSSGTPVCPSSSIAEGIVWAVDQGAVVLNLSLGGTSGSSAERNALQYARSRDVLPFCSAGNQSGSVTYPAAFPECVAVSATDWSDGRASYSNYGPQIVLSAPGGDTENASGYSRILSAFGDGDASYRWGYGTSMASPQAAGLAALLYALGMRGDDEILQRMKSTADDLGPVGPDSKFGVGRINAFAAIAGLIPPEPDPVTITLEVRKRQDSLGRWRANLLWSGAVGSEVDIRRNTDRIATTANDGRYSDILGKNPDGTYRYKVCLTGTTVCSNRASVSF